MSVDTELRSTPSAPPVLVDTEPQKSTQSYETTNHVCSQLCVDSRALVNQGLGEHVSQPSRLRCVDYRGAAHARCGSLATLCRLFGDLARWAGWVWRAPSFAGVTRGATDMDAGYEAAAARSRPARDMRCHCRSASFLFRDASKRFHGCLPPTRRNYPNQDKWGINATCCARVPLSLESLSGSQGLSTAACRQGCPRRLPVAFPHCCRVTGCPLGGYIHRRQRQSRLEPI